MQICSESEPVDNSKMTSSEPASGRVKHGLQKYAAVDDVGEDANSSNNCRNREQTVEVNCIG